MCTRRKKCMQYAKNSRFMQHKLCFIRKFSSSSSSSDRSCCSSLEVCSICKITKWFWFWLQFRFHGEVNNFTNMSRFGSVSILESWTINALKADARPKLTPTVGVGIFYRSKIYGMCYISHVTHDVFHKIVPKVLWNKFLIIINFFFLIFRSLFDIFICSAFRRFDRMTVVQVDFRFFRIFISSGRGIRSSFSSEGSIWVTVFLWWRLGVKFWGTISYFSDLHL